MTPIRLAILFGGPSPEHEVSITSARGVLAHCDRERIEPVPIGMTREFSWVEGAGAEKMLSGQVYTPSGDDLGTILRRARIGMIFPLIHGTYGEDGTLQGHLETLGIPYIGCGVRASAIGMDKAAAKAVWEKEGLPVTPWRLLRRETWSAERIDSIRESFALPLFVKPADSGSSVGITKVKVWEDLESAVEKAFGVSRKVLIEKAIEGREIEVAVIGTHNPAIISLPGEIIPGAEFYDYDDKYNDGKAQTLVPADLPGKVGEEIRHLAERAWRAIDATGYARVDFLLDRQNRPVLNEINTIPGFTPISMFPKLLEYMGLPFKDLVTRLVDLTGEKDGGILPP